MFRDLFHEKEYTKEPGRDTQHRKHEAAHESIKLPRIEPNGLGKVQESITDPTVVTESIAVKGEAVRISGGAHGGKIRAWYCQGVIYPHTALCGLIIRHHKDLHRVEGTGNYL